MSNIDFEAIFAEVAEEMGQEESTTEQETQAETAEEVAEEAETQEGEVTEENPDEEQTEESTTQKVDQHKINQGFANLRKAKEQAEREAIQAKQKLSFFENLAQRNGLTIDQMIEQYQQALLVKEAESQNVPVDVLRKQQALEKRTKELEGTLKNVTEQQQATMFNQACSVFLKEVPLNEEELNNFFFTATQKGLDLRRNLTPEALKMSYFTVYPEKFEELTRQKLLQNQKKNQKRAPVVPTGSGGGTESKEEDVDKFLEEFFEGTVYADKIKKKK